MQIHIILDTSEDSLFGSEAPPKEYEITPLIESLKLNVAAWFEISPDSVSVEESDYKTSVIIDGETPGFNDEGVISQIINTTWETWLEQY